jgi:hypothetical protein
MTSSTAAPVDGTEPTADRFLPGTIVELRGLRWEVIEAAPMGDQTLLRLRGTAGPSPAMRSTS